MRDIVLSVDIGTSKICAVAWDATAGQVRALCAVENDANIPRPSAPDGHEQDPERNFERCLHALAEVVASEDVDAARVAGIGFSGQMHGVLLADAAGHAVTPFFTWRDARLAEDDPILSRGNEAANGCGLHPGYGGATLACLAREGQLPPGSTALGIAAYVAAKLCGVSAMEATHAASWGLFNPQTGDWDAGVVDALGIDHSILPPIVPSARPMGELTPAMASRLGVANGVPVCAPVGDNQASYIGVTGLDGKAAVLNLGTGGQISVPLQSYAFQPGLETRPLPFGGYILVGASLCGGWSYAYLCDFFRATVKAFTGTEPPREEVYARMNALARTDSAGLRCDTRFLGVRGIPGQRGAVANVDTTNLTPETLTRAMLEGSVNELLDMMPRETLARLDKIVATGNAVRRNPAMLPIIEALSGKACTLADTQEEAAAGAAIATAHGLSPREANT